MAIIIVPFFLIIIFVIYPTVKEIVTVNHEIVNERTKLEEKLALGLNMNKINDALKEVNESLPKLENIFIQKDHELEFISQLENMAAENGVAININSDFSGQKISDEISQVALQINLSGDYNNILKFIQSVESLPNYYNTNLILASAKQTGGSQQMTVQLTGQAYIQEKKK